MTSLRRELGFAAAALMFLTRLPLPSSEVLEDDHLARSARYFPVAGLCVGLVSGCVWLLASAVLPAWVSAGLACLAGVLVTGALHEDGLADTCDGFGGGQTKERILEIMRDSTIGTYGSIGLVMSIGLRWAALASCGIWSGFLVLVAAHTIGRAMVVAIVTLLAYVRADGAGRNIAGGVRGGEFAAACVITLAVVIVTAGWSGLLALLVAIGLTAVAGTIMMRKIGGYTGDTLGAVEQVAEISAFIVLASMVSP